MIRRVETYFVNVETVLPIAELSPAEIDAVGAVVNEARVESVNLDGGDDLDVALSAVLRRGLPRCLVGRCQMRPSLVGAAQGESSDEMELRLACDLPKIYDISRAEELNERCIANQTRAASQFGSWAVEKVAELRTAQAQMADAKAALQKAQASLRP